MDLGNQTHRTQSEYNSSWCFLDRPLENIVQRFESVNFNRVNYFLMSVFWHFRNVRIFICFWYCLFSASLHPPPPLTQYHFFILKFCLKILYDDFFTGRHPAGVEALWHGQAQQEFCNWYSWPLHTPLKPFIVEQKWETPY